MSEITTPVAATKKPFYKKWWFILLVLLWVIGYVSQKNPQETPAKVPDIESTRQSLVGYDWVYPNGSNPTGAWKFSSDGTFNYSTTAFGGMSAWGTWTATEPGKIRVEYSRATQGGVPAPQTLTLSGSSTLMVGSTNYVRM